MSKLVIVASYENETLAHLAKNILADEKIPAVLFDDGIVTMDWLLSNAVGGVKVKVREEDAERAWEVLKDHAEFEKPDISEEELAAEALAMPREDESEENEPEPEAALQSSAAEPSEFVDRDKLAWRAFWFVWWSFFIPPLSIYAVYLCWGVALDKGPLTRLGKLRLLTVISVLSLWLLAWAIGLADLIRR